MRLGFVVDAGSPLARAWIAGVVARGHEAHVLSTYPATPEPSWASFEVIPVAFSALSSTVRAPGPASAAPTVGGPARLVRSVAAGAVRQLRARVGLDRLGSLRDDVGPLDARLRRFQTEGWLARRRPELVHAMRIPFEGVLAAEGLRHHRTPLIVSVWGNDLTLHAPQSRLLARFTRRALARADALHTDCRVDQTRALEWGWSAARPWLLNPGVGGIDLAQFQPGPRDVVLLSRLGVPDDGAPLVVNARGMRSYVRNDSFFAAIPAVLAAHPTARFLSLGTSGHAQAEGWRTGLGALAERVHLLPTLPRSEVARLFQAATVACSPSEHDGTPNSLLEAMACGAFPVAGDIPSVREWITDGETGLLLVAGDSAALSRALIRALGDSALRESGRIANLARIERDAGLEPCRTRAVEFYEQVIGTHRGVA